tara:strand:- start:12440 stop:13063 length:624 start_codon:yes stop_codon:yes gene_type:complete
MKNIGVLNFGLGNISSIKNIIDKSGYHSIEIKEKNDLLNLSKIILPGVGHFQEAMNIIKDQNSLICELNNLVIKEKIPILGICLGMQLMTFYSEEGNCEGLKWIEASVKSFRGKLSNSFKVPHMGWNTLLETKEDSIVSSNDEDQRFYFVHSYFVDEISPSLVTSKTKHGEVLFCSSFQKDNFYGVQFHPEKSHKYGLNLFNSFLGG